MPITDNFYGSLTAAYGRRYNTKKEVETAFNEGKDFMLHLISGTTYINKEQYALGVKVEVRYGKNSEKVMVLTVK